MDNEKADEKSQETKFTEKCLRIFYGDASWRDIKNQWPDAAIEERRRKMTEVIRECSFESLRLSAERDELRSALQSAIKIADEVRYEWDAAPSGMKAGKLLIALSGNLKGYREYIDAIHSALAGLDAKREGGS